MTSPKAQALVSESTIEQIYVALGVIAGLKNSTMEERFYVAAKLRGVRTELSALIKANEAQK